MLNGWEIVESLDGARPEERRYIEEEEEFSTITSKNCVWENAKNKADASGQNSSSKSILMNMMWKNKNSSIFIGFKTTVFFFCMIYNDKQCKDFLTDFAVKELWSEIIKSECDVSPNAKQSIKKRVNFFRNIEKIAELL